MKPIQSIPDNDSDHEYGNPMKTKSNHVEGSLEEQPVIGTIDSAGRVEPLKLKRPKMHLRPFDERYFPSITIGGEKYDYKRMIIINTIADDLNNGGLEPFNEIASQIVQSFNEYDALNKLAEIAESFEKNRGGAWFDLKQAIKELNEIRKG